MMQAGVLVVTEPASYIFMLARQIFSSLIGHTYEIGFKPYGEQYRDVLRQDCQVFWDLLVWDISIILMQDLSAALSSLLSGAMSFVLHSVSCSDRRSAKI